MIRETELRERMVRDQISSRGVRDKKVLDALLNVQRHLFVPPGQRHIAYEDYPLPIGNNQTISQPYIVAYMTEQLVLTGVERVLEVGTGSGYQAAVLATLSAEVWTLEIIETLYRRARRLLGSLGYLNVHCLLGDGFEGAEAGLFDRIILTAAAPRPPEPLLGKLKPNGKLLLPLGPPSGAQELVLLEKSSTGFRRSRLGGVRFVPMTGKISRRLYRGT